MKRAAMGIAVAGLLVSACTSPTATSAPAATSTVPSATASGIATPSPQEVQYTDAQIAVYKQASIYETQRLNPVEGMGLNMDVPEEQWAPYVRRAKGICATARAQGWDAARQDYADQALAAVASQMPSAAGEPDPATLERSLNAVVDSQMRAIAAAGSLCPELAPPGFGTVLDGSTPRPSGSPLVDGKYYGEGCDGAGRALLDLIGLLRGIEDASTDITTFADDLTNIAAGLRYAALTEKDPAVVDSLNDGVDAVVRLQLAFNSGDPDTFGAQVRATSAQAITIIDTCGLQ